MAIPRLSPADGVALPRPLAAVDAARIRRVFTFQARGDMAKAAEESAPLADSPLLGHILADRYLRRPGDARVDALREWLARYPNEPDAEALGALLLRRLPPGAPQPSIAAAPADIAAEPGDSQIARRATLDRAVAERARTFHARAALHLIETTRNITPAYRALLQAEVAQSLFFQNQDAEAMEMAAAAVRRTPRAERVGLAGYVAGLAAWRLGRMEQARGFFEEAAQAALATRAQRSAAAFWAGRAHLRLFDAAGAAVWMKRAAAAPRTLHGLMARRLLGLGYGLTWQSETLSEADVSAVGALPGGYRAFALLQVGQADRAEAELRRLWPASRNQPALSRALLLVASGAGFTDLAAWMAEQSGDDQTRDFARFPIPRLSPRGGFRVDPALVYALARVESNFDAGAVSPAGARGLMQLMPVTAGFMANDASFTGRGRARLHDPAVNLELGQRYVAYLAQQDGIDGDLIRLLASYNSGPGSFARWRAELRDQGDPLLFIEAIPNAETRQFVVHALTYTWIYAARLNLPAPSIDELAHGHWPRFTPLAKPATMATPRWH